MKKIIFLTVLALLIACGAETDSSDVTDTIEATEVPVVPVATLPPPPLSGHMMVATVGDLMNGQQPQLMDLDLATGETAVLREFHILSYVSRMALSSNGQLALSYSPPPKGGLNIEMGGIYMLDMTDLSAELTPILEPTVIGVFFDTPLWSEDGQSLYYTYTDNNLRQTDGQSQPIFYNRHIGKVDLQTGQITQIVEDGLSPALSPDGQQLVYIYADPISEERSIRVSGLDGSNMREIVPLGTYLDIDYPEFSADGDWIYASVIESRPETASLFDTLFGVRSAAAHALDLPAGWWRFSLDGTKVERLTQDVDIMYHGAFATDKRHILFTTPSGLLATTDGGKTPFFVLDNQFLTGVMPLPE